MMWSKSVGIPLLLAVAVSLLLTCSSATGFLITTVSCRIRLRPISRSGLNMATAIQKVLIGAIEIRLKHQLFLSD